MSFVNDDEVNPSLAVEGGQIILPVIVSEVFWFNKDDLGLFFGMLVIGPDHALDAIFPQPGLCVESDCFVGHNHNDQAGRVCSSHGHPHLTFSLACSGHENKVSNDTFFQFGNGFVLKGTYGLVAALSDRSFECNRGVDDTGAGN
jgi:hypothetical protein